MSAASWQPYYPLYRLKKVLKVQEPGRVRWVKVHREEGWGVAAVVCENNAVLLRFDGCFEGLHSAGGITRTCLFFSNRKYDIIEVVFSPCGMSLAVTTKGGSLYIVCIRRALFHRKGVAVADPGVFSISEYLKIPKNALASGQDITKILTVAPLRVKGRDKVQIGTATGVAWWRDRTGEDRLVVACDGGFIIVVDIVGKKEVACVPIPIRPHDFYLARTSRATSLILIGKRGVGADLTDHVYCLPLEVAPDAPHLPWDSIIYPRTTLQTPLPPSQQRLPFAPTPVPALSGLRAAEIWVAPLNESRQGIFVYQTVTQEVKCYDAEVSEGEPVLVYVYRVGRGSSAVCVAGGLVFYSHIDGVGHQKISVLSRYGAATDTRTTTNDRNTLQELMLGCQERLVGFCLGLKKTVVSLSSLLPVVEFWTDDGVYVMEPVGVPSELFKKTVLEGAKSMPCMDSARLILHAEALGKAFNLDIIELYKQAALECEDNASWAVQLRSAVDGDVTAMFERMVDGGGEEDLWGFLVRCGVEKIVGGVFWLGVKGLLEDNTNDFQEAAGNSFASVDSTVPPPAAKTPNRLLSAEDPTIFSTHATAASHDDESHSPFLRSPTTPTPHTEFSPTATLLLSLYLPQDSVKKSLLSKLINLGLPRFAAHYATSSPTLSDYLISASKSYTYQGCLLAKLSHNAPYAASASPGLFTMPYHNQALVCLEVLRYNHVPGIIMKIDDLEAMQVVLEKIPVGEVGLKTLALCRMSQITDGVYDDEACEILKTRGWCSGRVKRYCKWTGRLRVAAWVEELVGNYVKGLALYAEWLESQGEGKEETAKTAILYLKKLFDEHGPGLSQSDRRSCVRVVLVLWERVDLPPNLLVEHLKSEVTYMKSLEGVLASTPRFLKPLPHGFKIHLATHPPTAPPPTATLPPPPPPIYLPPPTPTPTIAFSCCHPAMPLTTYRAILQKLECVECPLAVQVVQATGDQRGEGVVSQGCPRCVYEAFGAPYPPEGSL